MIYFCADDYGISANSNERIKICLENGVLNKVSVLPNGETTSIKQHLSGEETSLSLHINLVEGYPLSDSSDVDLLISENGYFKYSFMGLFLLSLSSKKRELEKQLYKELQNQIRFWKQTMGEKTAVSIDSHQHTHMIPLIFKTLMRVIKDEKLNVECIRIPAEPISPYLFTPSLYLSYRPVGLVKQWILKILAFANRIELKKSELSYSYFMGVMFSGRLTEKKIKKLLPRYLKLAKKNNKNIEIGFHPGFLCEGEELIPGCQKGFKKFYFSPWRNTEYDTLINFRI